MKLSFFPGNIEFGNGPLDKISQKYLQEYYATGGTRTIDPESGIHHFWYAMEKKFNITINWKKQYIEFHNENDYLCFLLKEM